ncbi:MAG: hypothetical protein ACYC6N_11225 [Pirellulaceae bacterium]
MNPYLIDTLAQVGKPSHRFRAPDGTEVLVLPYGGRVLGLFSPQSDENFFWTHTALASATSAADFYAGDQWHNSGGDRTWLAPEVDFFFPEFPKTDVYWQPRPLDPGDWQMAVQAETVRLVNRLTHRLSRAKADVELEITKVISPAPNPLRHERAWTDGGDVEYAGYSLRTSLAWLGELQGGPIGLWNLIQMPHGGDLLVPTYCQSSPRVLFGDVSPQDLETGRHLIRYAMRAKGEHKIAIRAIATAGRIGYRYLAADGRWALIVRNVFVDPSGLYVDVPWSDVKDFGYAVQACNIHSALGSFSELEYHVPAIGPGTGRVRCDDVSQTWAFRGSRAAIDRIVGQLLTSDATRTA